MEIQATNVFVNQTFADKLVSAFGTAPTAPLIGPTPKVHLITGSISLTPQTTLAELTAVESAFTGYAPATPQSSVGTITVSTNVVGIMWTAMFQTSDTTVGAVINGYWLDGQTPADWVVAEVLDTPVNLGPGGNVLAMTVVVPVGEFFRLG